MRGKANNSYIEAKSDIVFAYQDMSCVENDLDQPTSKPQASVNVIENSTKKNLTKKQRCSCVLTSMCGSDFCTQTNPLK
jgi:hypothetical protein